MRFQFRWSMSLCCCGISWLLALSKVFWDPLCWAGWLWWYVCGIRSRAAFHCDLIFSLHIPTYTHICLYIFVARHFGSDLWSVLISTCANIFAMCFLLLCCVPAFLLLCISLFAVSILFAFKLRALRFYDACLVMSSLCSDALCSHPCAYTLIASVFCYTHSALFPCSLKFYPYIICHIRLHYMPPCSGLCPSQSKHFCISVCWWWTLSVYQDRC